MYTKYAILHIRLKYRRKQRNECNTHFNRSSCNTTNTKYTYQDIFPYNKKTNFQKFTKTQSQLQVTQKNVGGTENPANQHVIQRNY